MIKLVNVNKTYGKGDSAVHALKDVNLELPSGKFISIVGKSGSGKSTLMNIIGALDSVSDKKNSQVIVGDKDITKLKDNELADYRNKKIGYIFQSFYLEPTFTVLENVAMPLTIAGKKKKEREAMAMEAIKKLGLEEKAKKLASELSGGQKQRVSIARALVSNPDLVLADEPTGNLDSQNGQEVIKLLQQICYEGKTVVLVTHNIEDARKTDIMVEIKDGVISNVIYNDEDSKRRAQTVTDYDANGNLINKNNPQAFNPGPINPMPYNNAPIENMDNSWSFSDIIAQNPAPAADNFDNNFVGNGMPVEKGFEPVPFAAGVPFNNGAMVDNFAPIENTVPIENVAPVQNAAPMQKTSDIKPAPKRAIGQKAPIGSGQNVRPIASPRVAGRKPLQPRRQMPNNNGKA